MKIISGDIPEGEVWRSLVFLSTGDRLGLAWHLGLRLARANSGELVTAVIVPTAGAEHLDAANKLLAEARALTEEDATLHTLIIAEAGARQNLRRLVEKGSIDLLLATPDSRSWSYVNQMPCAVAAVRGEAYSRMEQAGDNASTPMPVFDRILVPTSGGPNSVHALSFLLPLTPQSEVTALYVAPTHLGSNEEALGRARLRQTLNFIDANERIKSTLITPESVIEGIIDEAGDDYDLVILGASQESTIDHALFGNIPAAVVRECKKPVVVVRQPHNRIGNLLHDLSWAIQHVIPRMNLHDRTQAYVRIRRAARPDIDFFVLISLATAIAALGLLLNSPAVVIGAMLVAPLMSPIAGFGLAIVLGDPRFLRLVLGAVLRGVLLAIFIGFLSGLLRMNEPLTSELLARTQPTLLDLGVALFSGMAVAYALSRSEAAAALPGVAIAAALVPPLATIGIAFATGNPRQGLGALLLFSTNLVAIGSAAALVFLILGFRPMRAQKARRTIQVRSARVALLLLLIISALLALTTLNLAREAATESNIRELAQNGTADIINGELAEIDIGDLNETPLKLELTIRATNSVPHAAAVELQTFIATELQREVELLLTVIPSTKLDPFVPPTQTLTPTPTLTSTSGPTPTFTPTFTATPTPTETPTVVPTNTPSPTATPLPTETPTRTPTPTATPQTAVINHPFGLNLRAEPDSQSELLAFLEEGTVVILLDGYETTDEGDWQQVEVDGQTGWLLAGFLTL